jgi:hypothetical protein
MDFSIIKAIAASELREHANEHFIYINFTHGKGEDEMLMLEALEHSKQLCGQNMCEKCDVSLKYDKKGYLYIEFCLERDPDIKKP